MRQIIVIRPPRFLGTVRLIRGQGRVKVRRIRGEGRFSSELRFDQKYREALTAPLGSVGGPWPFVFALTEFVTLLRPPRNTGACADSKVRPIGEQTHRKLSL